MNIVIKKKTSGTEKKKKSVTGVEAKNVWSGVQHHKH